MKGKEGESPINTKLEDIKKLGSEKLKRLFLKDMEDLKSDTIHYSQYQTIFDKAKYVLLAPIQRVPNNVFTAATQLVNSQIQLPDQYKTGFAMRHIQSASIIGKQHELYESGVYQELAKKNPATYAIPYLFLCANTNNPTDAQFTLPHDARSRCMQLYYSAVNFLLLRKMKQARDMLMQAKSYTKSAHEMVTSISDMLALACFLNGDPKEVFEAFTSPKIINSQWVKDIWEFKMSDKFSSVPNKLYAEIEFEVIVRQLTRLAQTSTRSTVNFLKELCGAHYESAIKEVTERGIVGINIEDDIATFTENLITAKLEEEAAEVTKLMNVTPKK